MSCLDKTPCAARREVALAGERERKARAARDEETRHALRRVFGRLVTDEAEGRSYETILREGPGREVMELRGFGDTLYGGGAWLATDAEAARTLAERTREIVASAA